MFTVVKASEMYPKPRLIRDSAKGGEECDVAIPFVEIPGEAVTYLGETADDNGVIALSNYRLHISRTPAQQQPAIGSAPTSINIPLTCIETVELRDLFYIHIYCKDARFYLVQFSDSIICKEWVFRISAAIAPPTSIEQVFAFVHHAWARESKRGEASEVSSLAGFSENGSSVGGDEGYGDDQLSGHVSNWFRADVARLRFDFQSVWRISSVNKDFKMCSSYPPELLVPASISDQVLEAVSKFRLAGRIPTIVWRHTGNGAVLARCSQPAVGWLGWRSSEDEELVNAIAEACAYDTGSGNFSSNASSLSNDEIDGADFDPSDNALNVTNGSDGIPSLKDLSAEVAASRRAPNGELKKVLIVDARSYIVGIGNRTRGGGVEYPEYYPTSEILFMGLCNIHDVRKSFHRLRTICSSTPIDQTTWLQNLDQTKWLHYLSGLLRTANICAKALHVEARPVMVHCSDGWDRTPQIVALTELLVDPYYRSLEGFRVLVEKEWLDFGHKMADRCGLAFSNSDANERCPIFLQFLDCVHQLLLQFPCDFEFNISYLFKLAQHTYSSLFGTFLCNSLQERQHHRVAKETRSVWDFLASNPYNFCNLLYHPRNEVLWPKFEVRDLLLWQDVYVSEQGRGGPVVTGAAADLATPGSSKGLRSGCVSSSEDSGANNSRDGSENGELQCQDISLVREELEKLQVNCCEPIPTSIPTTSRPSSANKSSTTTTTTATDCDEEPNHFCGCAINDKHNPNYDEQTPLHSTSVRSHRMTRHIETSTDTLVPDCDVEERLRARSSTLVAHDAVIKRDEEVQLENGDYVSVTSSTVTSKDPVMRNDQKHLSDKATSTTTATTASTTQGDRRCKLDSRRGNNNCGTLIRPLLERTGSSRWPCEVPSAAQERADAYFKNRFDTDGLPVHQTEAQRRLVAIYFTHQEQVEALQRDLHLTRIALCKQKSSSCKCQNNAARHPSEEDYPALRGGDAASGSSTAASEASSTWETVDERETKPTLWVPDHAAAECMGCHTTFWLGRRRHHCRSCGNLVCGDCSSNSLPLPAEQLYHPVRICDACFRNNSVTNQQQPDDDETIETSENVFRDVSETDDDDAKQSDVNVVVNVVEDELTIGPSSDLKAAQCFDKNSE